MCAIFGALVRPGHASEALKILETIWDTGSERGRDGRGFYLRARDTGYTCHFRDTVRSDGSPNFIQVSSWDIANGATIIGNFRAEPTTEYVADKSLSDQQPYVLDNWAVVHNGTIANDKALRTGELTTTIDSAAIVEQLASENVCGIRAFQRTVKRLKGSYAIAAFTKQTQALYIAANYRPIWYIACEAGLFFASTRDSFPDGYFPRMHEPYSVGEYVLYGQNARMSLRNPVDPARKKALVVCSGGLDSVVSAVYAQKRMNLDVELLHFHYGSRAASPETKAIHAVAKALNVPVHIKMLPMWDKEDSPLLQADSAIAGGEQGAEFAHEWVPARNLVMLAVATAYAEAKGFGYIVLGNNLEEAGAYPDNEPEFIAKFNDLLPFAVGDGRRVSVIMPVGNMMKHEIVKLGLALDAPLHLTWSCYRAGEVHCGKCGPCFMRRTAFKINGAPEVIDYESNE